MQPDDDTQMLDDRTRREFLVTAALAAGIAGGVQELEAQAGHPEGLPCSLTINNIHHDLLLDPRVTLLDLLREQLHLTGTKKGCDHGQCGACTVLANGERINSCLALAISHQGEKITTIEGLGDPDHLHPMQASFLKHDGFQCGFCTSGQICSSVAMLEEARKGTPSAVTYAVNRKLTRGAASIEFTEQEVRERMSGNLCRCGAYPNIVAAVRAVHLGEKS